MSVLPSEASLASFFVVLVLVLLVTVSLGLSLRSLLATVNHIQRRVSEYLYNLLRFNNKERTKDYGEDVASLHLELSHDHTFSIVDYCRAVVDIISESSFRSLVEKASEVLISLPRQELSYDFRLFLPSTVPFYVEKRFSCGKLVADILRILLLPLWIVLGFLLLLLKFMFYIGSYLSRCCCCYLPRKA